MNVEELIAELPGTPDEIAAHLRELGIKGVKDDSRSCPIASYLIFLLGARPDDFMVCGPCAHWYEDLRYHDPVLPLHIRSFITRFDLGYYPDLEVQ